MRPSSNGFLNNMLHTTLNLSVYRKNEILEKLSHAGFHPLDIMVTGVTGAGKSSTLNAFFRKEIASVGYGVDPETKELDAYSLNDVLRLWDTPGLGDGVETDKIHKKKLVDLLYKPFSARDTTHGFIDLVLIIIEGSNRDMGTTYTLLNEVIVPNIQKDRILIAINQADAAMKGRHWNYLKHTPDPQLSMYLNEQACSVQRRVQEATGVEVYRPVVYSAKYGYNITKLFDFLFDHIPKERRPLIH